MLHKILFMHSKIIVKDNIVQFDNLQRLNKLYNNSKYYRTTEPARNFKWQINCYFRDKCQPLKRKPTHALVDTHKKCFKKLISTICCVKNNFNEMS